MIDKSLKIISTFLSAAALSFALVLPTAAGAESTSKDDIFWVLELELAEGADETFDSLIAEMVASTEEEKGALTYETYRDGNKVYFLERYDTNEDVIIHLGNFGSKFAERFLAILTPGSFKVYGPADEAVREALAGFNPEYYDPHKGFAR